MTERLGSLDRLAGSLTLLLWPHDPDARFAISIVCGSALVAFAILYLPSLWRLIRLQGLSRRLTGILESVTLPAERREEVAAAFENSPARSLGADFIERWIRARPDPDAEVSSARFSDLLEERPLLPRGPRSSILAALPSLLLAIGILATFAGLARTLSEEAPVSSERAHVVQPSEPGSQRMDGDSRRGPDWDAERLAHRIALALHASLWGILLCLLSGLAIRWLEGSELACGDAISESMGRAFPGLSKSEAAAFAARAGRRRDEQLAEQMRSESDARIQVTQSIESAGGALCEASRDLAATAAELQPMLQELRQLGRSFDLTASSLKEGQTMTSEGISSIRDSVRESGQALVEQRDLLDRSLSQIRVGLDQLGRGLGEDLTRALEQVDSTLERFSEKIEDAGRRIESLNADTATSTSGQAPPHPAATPSHEANADMSYADLYRNASAGRPDYSPPRQRPAVENAPLRGLSGLLSKAPATRDGPPSRRGDEDPEK